MSEFKIGMRITIFNTSFVAAELLVPTKKPTKFENNNLRPSLINHEIKMDPNGNFDENDGADIPFVPPKKLECAEFRLYLD